MTREELQQEIKKLEERRKDAMRQYENDIYEAVERKENSLRELDQAKHDALSKIAQGRREVDSVMRKASRDAKVRYKEAVIAIDNDRQRLFADYKAQVGGEENPSDGKI